MLGGKQMIRIPMPPRQLTAWCSCGRERSGWESLLCRWEGRAPGSGGFQQEKEKFHILESPMNKKEEQVLWSLLLGRAG